MNNNLESKIALLQDNLKNIRQIANWSMQDLAERIGVTAQTISNIESKKTPLTQLQYIAIRAILDCEIQNNSTNSALRMAVILLLYKYDDLPETQQLTLKKNISFLAAAAAGGLTESELSDACDTLLSPYISYLEENIIKNNQSPAIVSTKNPSNSTAQKGNITKNSNISSDSLRDTDVGVIGATVGAALGAAVGHPVGTIAGLAVGTAAASAGLATKTLDLFCDSFVGSNIWGTSLGRNKKKWD